MKITCYSHYSGRRGHAVGYKSMGTNYNYIQEYEGEGLGVLLGLKKKKKFDCPISLILFWVGG